MLVHFNETIRIAQLQAIRTGLPDGKLLFYSADKPNPGDSITDQILIGTANFMNPGATIAGMEMTFHFVNTDIQASASGFIHWARFLDAANGWIGDVDVSDLNGTGAIRIDNIEVYLGGTIRIITPAKLIAL